MLPTTVKVYVVPLVKPLTVIGDVPVPVSPSGDDVAVYVMVLLPMYVEAVNVTVADASPAVAVPIVGVLGFLPPDAELPIPKNGIMRSSLLRQPTYRLLF